MPEPVSLRDYLESRINDLDRLTEARFVTHRTLLDSQAEKVKLALEAADKAITKQEATTNERLHLLNELRSGVATKEQLEALIQRMDDMKERIDKAEGKGLGLNAAVGYALAAITIIVFAVNYIFSA